MIDAMLENTLATVVMMASYFDSQDFNQTMKNLIKTFYYGLDSRMTAGNNFYLQR